MDLVNQVQIFSILLNRSRKECLSSISSLSLCILKKNSVILTYIDDCLIVSNKQETITSLIESLNNFTENILLIDEEDI